MADRTARRTNRGEEVSHRLSIGEVMARRELLEDLWRKFNAFAMEEFKVHGMTDRRGAAFYDASWWIQEHISELAAGEDPQPVVKRTEGKK